MNHKLAKKNNVTWFNCYVSQEDREKVHGHRGAVIWFTGLSSSGKSTIAHLVENELHQRGCSTYVLDGDNVRHGFEQCFALDRGYYASGLVPESYVLNLGA